MSNKYSYAGTGAEFWEYPEFKGKGTPACTSEEVDLFFAETTDSDYGKRNHQAKKVCAECPYVAECLEWALKNNEIGVWGGTTERDRKALKRKNFLHPRPLYE